MKQLCAVVVHGRNKEWEFRVEASPHEILAWRLDGLRVDEILNTVPEWVWNHGLAGMWCVLQDVGVIPK